MEQHRKSETSLWGWLLTVRPACPTFRPNLLCRLIHTCTLHVIYSPFWQLQTVTNINAVFLFFSAPIFNVDSGLLSALQMDIRVRAPLRETSCNANVLVLSHHGKDRAGFPAVSYTSAFPTESLVLKSPLAATVALIQ